MKKVIDWLDAAKDVTGSDYATAKALGISRQMVSKMRAGATIPTNKNCVRLAEIIGVRPLEIIASCEVQKDPAEEKRWAKWLGAAAILAGIVMVETLTNSGTYNAELMGLFIPYAKWSASSAFVNTWHFSQPGQIDPLISNRSKIRRPFLQKTAGRPAIGDAFQTE